MVLTNCKKLFAAAGVDAIYTECEFLMRYATGMGPENGAVLIDKDGVIWQTGELGKVDCGGGGTVAKYIAKHNIDTIDLGVPLISMHAPYEVVSKVDLFETYRAIRAFNKN